MVASAVLHIVDSLVIKCINMRIAIFPALVVVAVPAVFVAVSVTVFVEMFHLKFPTSMLDV